MSLGRDSYQNMAFYRPKRDKGGGGVYLLVDKKILSYCHTQDFPRPPSPTGEIWKALYSCEWLVCHSRSSQKDFLRTFQGLSQVFPRSFPGLCLDFLKVFSICFQDFVRTSSGLSKDFPDTFPGLSFDFPRTFSGHSRDFLGTFSGLSLDFLMTFFGLFWTFSGLS